MSLSVKRRFLCLNNTKIHHSSIYMLSFCVKLHTLKKKKPLKIQFEVSTDVFIRIWWLSVKSLIRWWWLAKRWILTHRIESWFKFQIWWNLPFLFDVRVNVTPESIKGNVIFHLKEQRMARAAKKSLNKQRKHFIWTYIRTDMMAQSNLSLFTEARFPIFQNQNHEEVQMEPLHKFVFGMFGSVTSFYRLSKDKYQKISCVSWLYHIMMMFCRNITIRKQTTSTLYHKSLYIYKSIR